MKRRLITVWIAIAWAVLVLGAYYAASAPYYAEKFSVFGRHFANLLGLLS